MNLYMLAASADSAGGSGLTMIIPLVLMVAVFYFMVIRPENKKKKEATEMRNSLKVGDEITTIGGIKGTVCAVKEETLVIETGADRVRIEFAKWALATNDTAAAAVAASKASGKNKKTKKDKE